MSSYLVVIEQEGDSWGAYCPDLPGVGVVDNSRRDEGLIHEAVTLHIEGLRKSGDPIPEPTAAAATRVEISVG
jgi:predicted RNase H-like HicB family nuclease